MNCAWIRRSLSAYLDERTTSAERLKIGLHLNQCRDCRHDYNELRRIRLALLNTSAAPVPAGFAQGWRARLHQDHTATRPATGRVWRKSLILAPAAASLLVICAGLAFFWPRTIMERVGQPARTSPRVADMAEANEDDSSSAPARTIDPKPLPAPPDGSSQPPPGGNAGGGWLGTADSGFGSGLGSSLPGPAGSDRPSEARSDNGTALAMRFSDKAAPAVSSPDLRDGVGLKVDDSWRVWLLAVGPRQAALRRALVSLGLTELADGRIPLEAPLLLWEDLTYSQAKSLAQAIEDAGGRAMVELIP